MGVLCCAATPDVPRPPGPKGQTKTFRPGGQRKAGTCGGYSCNVYAAAGLDSKANVTQAACLQDRPPLRTGGHTGTKADAEGITMHFAEAMLTLSVSVCSVAFPGRTL